MKVIEWMAAEIAFKAEYTYENPFEDVILDIVFEHGERKLTVPAFWDGGNVWRVRFCLTDKGIWKYKSLLRDKKDCGLMKCGSVECVAYDGELEIYKHGFLKTEKGKRYFMYNDMTPFFYLGDTHWNFAAEEFDCDEEHTENTACSSHFKYIVDERVRQGFTVYQSEPIGALYDISNGVNEADIEGFRDLDRRFAYIAKKGLVHANAQLVFPSVFVKLERYDDDEYIKKLARFWVARYSAYPVLWTLGQEVDKDFYYLRGDQRRFTRENNPFKLIAETIAECDAYSHPLTAHMENYSPEVLPKDYGVTVSSSAFREVSGHTWYALQWSTPLDKGMNFEFSKELAINSQGKVTILYESKYDHLWTMCFGERAQGWLAFLNGLYGYGYGAIDIWLYKSTYCMDTVSSDGADLVTPEDKAVKWQESLQFESAYQMGYLKEFFKAINWYLLEPRFDFQSYFIPEDGCFYSLASDERKIYVIYFYNKSDKTGMLTQLENSAYTMRWFNPRNGEFIMSKGFKSDKEHQYDIGAKPDCEDWVLLIKKEEKSV